MNTPSHLISCSKGTNSSRIRIPVPRRLVLQVPNNMRHKVRRFDSKQRSFFRYLHNLRHSGRLTHLTLC